MATGQVVVAALFSTVVSNHGTPTDPAGQPERAATSFSPSAAFRGRRSDYAYRHADSSSVRDLAQRMAWVQATEINEFRDTAARNHLPVDIDPAQPTVPNPSGKSE